MDLEEQVKCWIQWSRENIPPTGDIPKINCVSPWPPWLEDRDSMLRMAANDRDKLLTCFLNLLLGDPRDVPTRFAALHVYGHLCGLFDDPSDYYHSLLDFFEEETGLESLEMQLDGMEGQEDMEDIRDVIQEEYEGLEKVCKQKIDEFAAAMREDFRILTNSLKVEDVPENWCFIRWEILNSFAVQDSARALRLYNKAEDLHLLDPAELQALRGQLRFMVVAGPRIDKEFDLVDWEPKLSGPQDFPLDLLLFLWGLLALEGSLKLNESELDVIRDAANDLEKAVSKRVDLSPAYWSILARCYFLAGRFHDAAKQYQKILDSRVDFSVPKLRLKVYESLVTSYGAAHNTQKQIAALGKWAEEFPDERGIHLRIASMHAQEKDLPACAEALRKEEERNPQVAEDPFLSALLVAGETWQNSEAEKSRLRARPEYEQIESLLREYWPSFAELGDKAREEWIFGILETHFCVAQGRIKSTYDRKANASFTQAVEMELSSRVFVAFQEGASADPRLNLLAGEAVKEKNTELNPFAKFILKKAELGIGQMAYILDHSQNSKHALFQEFRAWVQSSYPKLLAHMDRVYKIAKFRNPALHRGISNDTIEHIQGWCRDVIDSICSAINT